MLAVIRVAAARHHLVNRHRLSIFQELSPLPKNQGDNCAGHAAHVRRLRPAFGVCYTRARFERLDVRELPLRPPNH
jgi:hypothetical protein